MSELSVMGVMKSIVPITRFNKGEANRIVMKNNRPTCVLMSPNQYESLMEMLSDYIMQEEADNRMARCNPEETISQDDMIRELGLTREDLDDVEVEIE